MLIVFALRKSAFKAIDMVQECREPHLPILIGSLTYPLQLG